MPEPILPSVPPPLITPAKVVEVLSEPTLRVTLGRGLSWVVGSLVESEPMVWVTAAGW